MHPKTSQYFVFSLCDYPITVYTCQSDKSAMCYYSRFSNCCKLQINKTTKKSHFYLQVMSYNIDVLVSEHLKIFKRHGVRDCSMQEKETAVNLIISYLKHLEEQSKKMLDMDALKCSIRL